MSSPSLESPERPISSAAELCLTLIMILPEQKDREERVRDFCRLYDIVEKRPLEEGARPAGQPEAPSLEALGRIFPPKK